MDVFFSADDRQEYLDLSPQSASKHAPDFLAGYLMSNHAHFVVVPVGRDRSRARLEKRIADTPGWSIAMKVGGVLCGRSASILVRWTNGKVWDHSREQVSVSDLPKVINSAI